MEDLLQISIPENMGMRRARTWFDTVFNPFLRGLEQERYLISIRNWTFRTEVHDTLSRIGAVGRWVDYAFRDNLIDVYDRFPEFEKYQKRHDFSANMLYISCAEYYQLLVNHIGLHEVVLSCCEDLLKRDDIRSDEVSKVDDLKEKIQVAPQQILPDIAEYLVNNIPEIDSRNVYSPLYNRYYLQIGEMLNTDEKLVSICRRTDKTGEYLLGIITEFHDYIFALRKTISDRFDMPYIESK